MKRIPNFGSRAAFGTLCIQNYRYLQRRYLPMCALLQELQRSQSLLTSAEAELHHVKEMNVDLKRHNALLEQEKLKVGT